MAAAGVARRAVQQHQGAPLQALQLAVASRLGGTSTELINPDMRLSVPGAAPLVPHDWPSLLDRRPCVVYSYGLTPLKAWNYAAVRGYYMRNISQLVAPTNNKRAFLVDTLALVIPQFSSCKFLSVFIICEFLTKAACSVLFRLKWNSGLRLSVPG